MAADRLDELMQNLWGKPPKTTLEFDAFVRQIPVARDYIKPLALDRWSRFATSLVSNLTLRTLRFSVVNRLQPLQTLYPLIGERLIANAKIMQHTAEGRKLLDEAGVDLDPGQFAGEQSRGTPVRKFVERVSGERSNQELAFLGMYLHGLEKGLDRKAAINYSKLRGQLLTQFTPLIVDTPSIMHGPIGRVLFQFKRFPVKQVELLSSMVADRNIPGIARFLAVMGTVGGLSLLLRQTYTDYDKRLKLKRSLDKELGQKASDVIYYGLPGLMGADLSGSFVLGDEPFGANIYEKIGRQVAGPALSIGMEVGKAVATPPRENISGTDKALAVLRKIPSLRPIAEIAGLAKDNVDVMTPDGEIKYRRKIKDALIGLGSFRSANEANIQLAVKGVMELKREIQTLKNAYYASGQSNEAFKAIEDFNQRWPEAAISTKELAEYVKYRNSNSAKTDADRAIGKTLQP